VADASLPILDALKTALAELYDVKLTSDLFEQFIPLLQAPQAFAEAYHRDRLIRLLGEAGAPLSLYGVGWGPLAERYGSFRYGGLGSFEETLHLVRRAKIVLNINNGFVAGGHERVFTAMCGGATVLSDANPFYAQAFKPNHEIAMFEWSKLDRTPAQIAALLADEPALAAMARAGARRALAEHGWPERASQLIEAVKQA